MPVGLMYHTSKTHGQKASKDHRMTTTDHNETLTLSPKTPLRNAHASSTPIRHHFPYLRLIPVGLMYHTSKTLRQKASKDHRMTTTDHIDALTNSPKTP